MDEGWGFLTEATPYARFAGPLGALASGATTIGELYLTSAEPDHQAQFIAVTQVVVGGVATGLLIAAGAPAWFAVPVATYGALFIDFDPGVATTEDMAGFDYWGVECFPAGTSITSLDGSLTDIEAINVGDQVAVQGATSTGTVTQVFRNITTEWLEIVWINPATGATEQIISMAGNRFLTPEGRCDRIVDMVDRSAVEIVVSIIAIQAKKALPVFSFGM